MRKPLILIVALALAFVAMSAEVTPSLQKYLERSSRVCPGGAVKVDAVNAPGPKNFDAYRISLSSSDERCGSISYAVVSPLSGQILVGQVYTLNGTGSVDTRISERVSTMMGRPVEVRIAQKAIEDGLKRVDLSLSPDGGTITFAAWLDESEHFFIIGRRGNIRNDPGAETLTALGIQNAPQRGSRKAPVSIVEISDLQCPMCGRAHRTLEPFLEKHEGSVKWSRLDLPLVFSHDWTLKAALGSRAVRAVAPEQYWNYVGTMFGNQEWLNALAIDSAVKDFCDSAEIDWKKVEPIYRSSSLKKEIFAQIGKTFEQGILSTPTFYVNGRQVFYGTDGVFFMKYVESLIPAKK